MSFPIMTVRIREGATADSDYALRMESVAGGDTDLVFSAAATGGMTIASSTTPIGAFTSLLGDSHTIQSVSYLTARDIITVSIGHLANWSWDTIRGFSVSIRGHTLRLLDAVDVHADPSASVLTVNFSWYNVPVGILQVGENTLTVHRNPINDAHLGDVRLSYGKDNARSLNPARTPTLSVDCAFTERTLIPDPASDPAAHGRHIELNARWGPGGDETRIFTGNLLQPRYSLRTGGLLELRLRAFGKTRHLADHIVNTPVLVNQNARQIIEHILKDAGWTPGPPSSAAADALLDTSGLDTVLSHWWADNMSAWDAIASVLSTVGPPAQMYEDGRGRLVVRGVDWVGADPRTLIQVTSDENVRRTGGNLIHGRPSGPIIREETDKDVINLVTARRRVLEVAATEDVWSAGEETVVPASGLLVIPAHLSSPVTAPPGTPALTAHGNRTPTSGQTAGTPIAAPSGIRLGLGSETSFTVTLSTGGSPTDLWGVGGAVGGVIPSTAGAPPELNRRAGDIAQITNSQDSPLTLSVYTDQISALRWTVIGPGPHAAAPDWMSGWHLEVDYQNAARDTLDLDISNRWITTGWVGSRLDLRLTEDERDTWRAAAEAGESATVRFYRDPFPAERVTIVLVGGTSAVTIPNLTLRGTPVREAGVRDIIRRDDDSIAEHGEINLNLDVLPGVTRAHAEALAETVVDSYAEGITAERFSVSLNDVTAAGFERLIDARTLDPVRLAGDRGDSSALPFDTYGRVRTADIRWSRNLMDITIVSDQDPSLIQSGAGPFILGQSALSDDALTTANRGRLWI